MKDEFTYWIDRLPPRDEWGHNTKVLDIYKEMPADMKFAMHFMPGVSVNDVPAESRWEIEELHLHAVMRLNWQARADLLRRARAAINRLDMGKALGALAIIESGELTRLGESVTLLAAENDRLKSEPRLHVEGGEMERLAELASVNNRSTIHVEGPEGWREAWVISNSDDNAWRYWRTEVADDASPDQMWNGPDWTADVNKACHFARREDAETWAHDDEDACFIRRRLLFASDGKSLPEMQQAGSVDLAIRENAAKELCSRAFNMVQAPANVFSISEVLLLLKEMLGFISFFAPGFKVGRLSKAELEERPLPPMPPHVTPVDKRSAAEVLMLFRAFVIRNATQWVLGAGDHHHPIWEMVATNAEGVEPTAGAAWAFIQPRNRTPLPELEYRSEELAASNEAEERGG